MTEHHVSISAAGATNSHKIPSIYKALTVLLMDVLAIQGAVAPLAQAASPVKTRPTPSRVAIAEDRALSDEAAPDEPVSEDVEVLDEMDREVAQWWQEDPPAFPSARPEMDDEQILLTPGHYDPLSERLDRFDPDHRREVRHRSPLRAQSGAIDPRDYDMPVIINVQVQSWLDFYTTRGRSWVRRYLERSGRFIPVIERILKEEGVPKDLAYVSMIESGFTFTARSWAGAVGPWQFMPATARLSGLTVTRTLDERRDLEQATRAAARHMKELMARFGDWYLVLAAYNAGAGRMENAIKRYGERDYWQLSMYDYLAMETKLYVPKYLAALIIARNPGRYGFHRIHYQKPDEVILVDVPGPAGLDAIARSIGEEPALIRELNAKYVTGTIPADGTPRKVRIPAAKRDVFAAAWRQVPLEDRLSDEHERTPAPRPKVGNTAPKQESAVGGSWKSSVHVVRFGETLGSIAQIYGMTVEQLVETNGIDDPRRIHPGQKLTVSRFIKDPDWGKGEDGKPVLLKARPQQGKPNPFNGPATGRAYHVVTKGDTLWKISKRYGVPLQSLLQWNRFTHKTSLRIGQRVVVRR